MSKSPSPMLLALTAAAAALPGLSPKAAAAEVETGYRFSRYAEANLPADVSNGGDRRRYEVLTHQFQVLDTPASGDAQYSADLTVETMSGASPWYVLPGNSGKNVQILSGATIRDERAALDLGARQSWSWGRSSVTLGTSKERDYLSVSGGVEGEMDFDEKRRTLSAGLGYSHDQLEPTEGGSTRFPNRIVSADKNQFSAYTGFTQVLSPQTVAQVALSYRYSDGYLSDPYKLAYVAGNLLPDSRPGVRSEVALSLRLRQYLPSLNAALHVDARVFRDDWGIGSDTVEAAWVQSLPGDWRLTPSLRWYQQGYADFYQPYYDASRADGFYSSDYRLSAFGAISARLSAEKTWRGWGFALALEGYQSDKAFSTRSINNASPGLVDFFVVSAAVSYGFSFGQSPAASPTAVPQTTPDAPISVVPVTP